MRKIYKFLLISFLLSVVAATVLFFPENIVLFTPKGPIAQKQLDLLIITSELMLIVIVPTLILTVFFAWKYREGNNRAKYSPDSDYNVIAEAIWWGVPCIIVTALSILTYKSCHELDPYRPLDSMKKPIKIQVVALQWKWLFIYPEQGIAYVNFLPIPKETPIDFEITADAPMNSFWIPQLGGQVYAMPGMNTQMHLMAHTEGRFRGSSANLSGRGFAGMKFIAEATSQVDFESRIGTALQNAKTLTEEEYARLVEPSENDPVSSYALQNKDLYRNIIMKYMMP